MIRILAKFTHAISIRIAACTFMLLAAVAHSESKTMQVAASDSLQLNIPSQKSSSLSMLDKLDQKKGSSSGQLLPGQVAPLAFPAAPRVNGRGIGLLAKNLHVISSQGTGLFAIHMLGWLNDNTPDDIVNLNGLKTLNIQIAEGDIEISPTLLENLLNNHILNYENAPLRQLKVKVQANQLKITGEVNPLGLGLWFGLRLNGDLQVDSIKNVLVLTPTSVHIAGMPMYGMIKMIGSQLSYFVDLDRPGARIEGNNIELDPATVFPILRVQGQLASAKVTSKGVEVRFIPQKNLDASSIAEFAPKAQGDRFIWLDHGILEINNLVIDRPRLILTPPPGEALVFRVNKALENVMWGYARVHTDGMLSVLLPEKPNPDNPSKVEGDKL